MNHKYNILLVDDDTLIRDNICKRINDLNDSFLVKYQASNGVEALDIVKNNNDITLLITDVQMPQMNGLDLITNVVSINPQIQIAIISGYDEFSYVSAAIRSGASDYLLKPIDDARLSSFLTDIEGKLDLITQNQQSQFITQTLKGLTSNQNNGLSNHLYITMLNYGNLTRKAPISDYTHSIFSALSTAEIKNICNDSFDEYSSVIIADGLFANQKYVIISTDKTIDRFDSAVKKMHSILDDVISPISIFYQRKPVSAADLSTNIYKLQNLSSKLLVMGKSSIYDIDDRSKPLPPINISLIVYRFSNFLNNCNYDMFCAEFVEYFVAQIERNYTQQQIEDSLISLFCFLQDIEKEYDSDLITGAQDLILEKCAYNTNSEDAMKDIAKILFNCFASKSEENWEILIKDVTHYIDSHFNESLSIDALAQRFNYSNSWLIKTFKKYTSSTINDYITNIRIKEAKKLISSRPELSLRKIAIMCGYSDQQYFSRVFQKTVGMSPSMYRNKNSGDGSC